MRSAAMALFALLAAALPARAALDAEAKTPYQLHVLLHIADNRALTPLFQQELERTLRDQLRQSFGALAEVRVERKQLSEIAARGLEQALDGLERTDDTQTHFVLLDFTGGQYRLQSRAYDGMTGQAAAIVRRVETGDRALVPILAARLVEQGFAPVGTVTAATRGKNVDVRMALKGGGLGVPLSRWVKAGDVFAVSRVVRQRKDQQASRVRWALLEVREVLPGGVCRCRYWRRFVEDDLRDTPGVLGYRALKLATSEEPVRLRVLDEETQQPLDGTEVQVFRPDSKDRVKLTTNRDGLAVTREAFAHLAIAYLPSAGASLPIALIPGRTAVCRVKLKGGSEALAALEYRRDAWLRRVYDDVALVAERTRELAKIVNQSLPAAEAAARQGLKNFDEELTHLTQEHAELKHLAREQKLPACASI